MADPLLFGGKKYISTKDAAVLTGYSSDYVGQLARSGKVSSELVGHARYVEEAGLVGYVEESAKLKIRERTLQNTGTKDMGTTSKTIERTMSQSTVKATPGRAYKPFGTFADVKPLHPPPDKNHGKQEFKMSQHGVYAQRILSPHIILTLVVVLTVFGVYVSSSSSTMLAVHKSFDVDKRITLVSASVASVFDSLTDLMQDLFSRFAFVEKQPSNVAVSGESAFEISGMHKGARSPSLKNQKQGVVLLPSTGDGTLDDNTIVMLQESFSDEVQVVSDESGVSGWITPIFRETLGQTFLYVLVPLDSGDSLSSQP